MDIGAEHRLALRRMCYDILQQMPRWDWDDYFRRIQARGYRYFRRYDSAGHQLGYTIFYGNAAIPASEIARGLTYGKIEATWRSLHPESQQLSTADHPIQKPRPSFHANHVRYTLPISSNSYAADIKYIVVVPKSVDDIIHREVYIPHPEEYQDEIDVIIPTVDDVARVAVALFLGYLDAATAMSASCGGGGGNTTGWGRDKDDDDERWARRCALMASRLCKPAHRPKQKRGGYRR